MRQVDKKQSGQQEKPVRTLLSLEASLTDMALRRSEEASVKDLRIAAISSVGFAGFFRLNELANIQTKHLTFCDGFVKIFVPKSKTDVYKEGNLYLDFGERKIRSINSLYR